jgi:hypothetical protein
MEEKEIDIKKARPYFEKGYSYATCFAELYIRSLRGLEDSLDCGICVLNYPRLEDIIGLVKLEQPFIKCLLKEHSKQEFEISVIHNHFSLSHRENKKEHYKTYKELLKEILESLNTANSPLTTTPPAQTIAVDKIQKTQDFLELFFLFKKDKLRTTGKYNFFEPVTPEDISHYVPRKIWDSNENYVNMLQEFLTCLNTLSYSYLEQEDSNKKTACWPGALNHDILVDSMCYSAEKLIANYYPLAIKEKESSRKTYWWYPNCYSSLCSSYKPPSHLNIIKKRNTKSDIEAYKELWLLNHNEKT